MISQSSKVGDPGLWLSGVEMQSYQVEGFQLCRIQGRHRRVDAPNGIHLNVSVNVYLLRLSSMGLTDSSIRDQTEEDEPGKDQKQIIGSEGSTTDVASHQSKACHDSCKKAQYDSYNKNSGPKSGFHD